MKIKIEIDTEFTVAAMTVISEGKRMTARDITEIVQLLNAVSDRLLHHVGELMDANYPRQMYPENVADDQLEKMMESIDVTDHFNAYFTNNKIVN